MAKSDDRLDQVVRDARREAEKRATGYREQALKMNPWVCGGCARTFTHANLQLLEVHHKSGNYDDNPPGGSTDVLRRIVFDRLSQSLGQQFVLDYRPGASGNIGSEIAARAAPDGHTLLLNTLPFVVNPI